MKKIYIKLFRRSYRMLRHPRIREVGWLNAIVKKFYARQYWKPCVRTVAIGLSLGLFCAMIPMPFQMLLAAFLCFISKGNIPVALSACWISNPFTQLPLMFMQEKIGAWLRDHSNFGLLEKLDIEGTLPLVNQTVNLANFTVGVCITAIFMAMIAYPIVYLIYLVTPKAPRAPKPPGPKLKTNRVATKKSPHTPATEKI